MTQLLILMPINSRLSCLKKTNGFIDILSLINSGPDTQKRISKHIIPVHKCWDVYGSNEVNLVRSLGSY